MFGVQLPHCPLRRKIQATPMLVVLFSGEMKMMMELHVALAVIAG